jgi:hypothetical protein
MKTIRIDISITDYEFRQLEVEAIRRGMNKSELIRSLIAQNKHHSRPDISCKALTLSFGTLRSREASLHPWSKDAGFSATHFIKKIFDTLYLSTSKIKGFRS